MRRFIIEIPSQAIDEDNASHMTREDIADKIGEFLQAAAEAWTSEGDFGYHMFKDVKITVDWD